MRPGKILLAVIAGLVGLMAAGFMAAGAGMLWSYQTQRTAEGFFASPATELSTASYALTSDEVDLGVHPDWFPAGRVATVRIEVEAAGNAPVFVGIGPTAEVDEFLEGVAIAEFAWLGPDRGDVSYRSIAGGALPSLPTDETFWVASAAGRGLQTLTWDLQRGGWKMVVMNTDATPGVIVDASAGAKTDLLVPIALGLLLGGLLGAAVAAGLLVLALHRPAIGPTGGAAPAARRFSHYPVHLEGSLDPGLSRWQWLFKWLLVVPHLVVLAFLWVAFGVLTVVAGVAILFTGRYPRPIFDFNVGVMRWTWRVAFYSYSVLGTDQYPPFTLAETDYPATFDIDYPERLSRGLVLVKWWLLAIPHYLIVGLLTSGLVWWSTRVGESGNAVLQVGGGLIGLLVLIGAIALAFSGRYPEALFDLVVGLNRWVYRVWAYVGLMRDEYPPFRLDTGGNEPGTRPFPSPEGPTQGGTRPTRPDLIEA